MHVLVITLDQDILQSLDIPHNICWKDKSIVVEMKCIFEVQAVLYCVVRDGEAK